MASCTKGGRKGRKMAGRNTMKLPSADDVYRLTRKLDEQSDISLKEADWIYSLFSIKTLRTKLNPHSTGADSELMKALGGWFDAVAKKIEQGYRGNFVFTVYLKNIIYSDFLYPARRALLEQGDFKDLCNVIMVDEKIYSALPFKNFLLKNSSDLGCYYEMNGSWAGMLYYPLKTEKGNYTVLQFLEKFVPFAIEVPPAWGAHTFTEAFFEIAAKTREITRNLWNVNNREISCFIMSDFIRYNDISCIAAVEVYGGKSAAFRGKSTIFVEKEKAPFVKKVWGIPIEELVNNALHENVINEKEAQSLLNGKPGYDFPIVEFTKASTQYLNEMVKRKMKWESARKIVEDEEVWLEEIR